MKNLNILNELVEELNIVDLDRERGIYVLRVYASSIDIQGNLDRLFIKKVIEKFPESSREIDSCGYVSIQFEYKGVQVNICLT